MITFVIGSHWKSGNNLEILIRNFREIISYSVYVKYIYIYIYIYIYNPSIYIYYTIIILIQNVYSIECVIVMNLV